MKNYNIYNIRSLDKKYYKNYISNIFELESQCFSEPWSYQSFYQALDNPDYLFFLAIDNNNNLIGYLILYQVLKQGYITNLAVYKNFRNIGVASSLLDFLINYSKSNYFEFISLEVRKSNILAINLYKKFGFNKVGERKNFYIKPTENALILTRLIK
ncbi:MAG: ribosomal protein S18-alanine N-acetyltransferase [Oscillospiraceae bacterium]|nr:ribosomal protein S18-alanine N-acetyltransferase [Oscillospiraceae bacterium]